MRLRLVDTSVWIDHLRKTDPELSQALERNQVLLHPYVLGEIALGSLPKRDATLHALSRLPAAPVAREEEVHRLIEARRLWGTGIGYVDAHLLTSVLLTPGSLLWSRDRKLQDVAASLNVIALPER